MGQISVISIVLCSSAFLFYILLIHLSFIWFAFGFTTTIEIDEFGNETDKQALLAIKEQILEDPFKALSSWNDSIHFCDWRGVTCSSGRVNILSLSSVKLVGSLSPQIGNLTFLRALHLENNSFYGIIPQQIGSLSWLQNVSLHHNFFQGELPANLSGWSDMRVVDVSNNNLAGQIPSELGSLSLLLELHLKSNHLSGELPTSLGNLSALRVLHLSINRLQGSIPMDFGRLSNLEILGLSANNLSGLVPTQLYNISSIKIFALAGNQFGDTLPPILGLTLPNLEQFYFGGNQFSGPIPPSVENMSKIVVFDIGVNAFTGLAPENLGKLQNLKWENLGTNRLGAATGDDMSFLNSLVNCTNLEKFNLAYNSFRGILPASVANLSTKLNELGVEENHISGSIPHEIGNLASLVFLALSHNMLTGGLPESIGRLSKLQELYLSDNNISGKISSSIGNLSRLTLLSLEQNVLEGSLPVSLADCRNLQGLDLGHNCLTGTIPRQIFSLSSLTIVLSLSHNYLTGPLPFEVGQLKNLGTLDISENQLSGEIPTTLGDCQVLEFLYMQGNLFQGTIPSSFGQIRGIRVLDFSRNKLSGQIPGFLDELPIIQNLNLSYNMFEGEVPEKGVFGNASAFSIAGNMKLCGGIKALHLPACPANISGKHRKLLTIIISCATIFAILLIAGASAILYKIRRSKKKYSAECQLGNQFPKLSYAELLQATNGFCSANLIGEGRYGAIYKGILNFGEQVVAVKVLKLQLHGANKSFLAECEALRNTRHRNLVKIVTSCSSLDLHGNEFKALVFEFMPNGSLESWLHPISSEEQDPNAFVQLNFIQMLNIAIEVASALDYLHNHCETTIIHCDIKPSNVLLDDEFCGHLGDFGLAKFLIATTSSSDQTQSSSSFAVRGTIGYVAPEYATGLEVSKEGDVYSYGILLLEMFTGKRPSDNMFIDNFSFRDYVKMALPDGVVEISGSLLKMEEENVAKRTGWQKIRVKECLGSVLQIGVTCSNELPRERMEIKDALVELHMIRNMFLGDRSEIVGE